MARLRVAVIFGGRSSEHSISCISAGSVLSALDRTKYEVVPVGITKSGHWVLEKDSASRFQVMAGTFPTVNDLRPPMLFTADVTATDIMLLDTDRKSVPRVDVAFPVLHGPWGEDGTIQGMLELAGIPYVGSGVFASAAAMDKAHMKAMLANAGLPIAPYEVITARQWTTERDASIKRATALGFPLFVKPARAGSSVGITKVKRSADLQAAIETARLHDPKVVIEASVEGNRELECGVLDSASGPRASVVAEIVVRHGHEFYDYEAKYVDNTVDLVVPARLPDGISERAQEMAKEAFLALGCEGLARVDMFLSGGELLLNEVNTMPGFTPISMFPRMWQASGMDYPTLVDTLIQDAMRRGSGLR